MRECEGAGEVQVVCRLSFLRSGSPFIARN
jgi:hypothetical protein